MAPAVVCSLTSLSGRRGWSPRAEHLAPRGRWRDTLLLWLCLVALAVPWPFWSFGRDLFKGNAVKLFRLISLTEGVSWLLLFFIALPLKYGAGWPDGVRVMGRVHGGLFVLFVLTLARAAIEAGWGPRLIARAFLSSLVPLGAFWLERRFREEERALPARS